MATDSFVLFATGSTISVEYAATCRRLGFTLAAGVANRDCPSHLPADVEILGPSQVSESLLNVPCLCPLFTPANRRLAVREATDLGFRFPSALIDPTAIVADDLAIGGGSFINAGVVVGACTTLGAHVIVNRSSSIGHHGRLEDFASLGPGVILAGHVTVGSGAMIGAGAIVLPGVSIGENAVIGAGSIVTRDVPAGATLRGQAARLVEAGSSDGAPRQNPAP